MSTKTKCHICGGTGEILVTDWLTRGMTKEEIAREKEEALADIVEVVRCKNCKHLKHIQSVLNGELKCGYCRIYADYLPQGLTYRSGDDYCSYGERK